MVNTSDTPTALHSFSVEGPCPAETFWPKSGTLVVAHVIKKKKTKNIYFDRVGSWDPRNVGEIFPKDEICPFLRHGVLRLRNVLRQSEVAEPFAFLVLFIACHSTYSSRRCEPVTTGLN